MPNPIINRRTVANASNPFVYDPEVLDWISRVVGLGASVSQTTKDAADTLMKSIKALGLRSKILRMNIYAGSAKVACLAPLIKDIGGTTEGTISNAISASVWSYSETGAGGGLSNSGGDVLDTGVAANNASMGLEDYHIGVYKTAKAGGNIAMGAGTSGVGALYFYFDAGANKAYYTMFSLANDIPLISDSGQIGHYVASRNGTLTAYKNGSSVGSNASPGGARPNTPTNIFIHNASLDGIRWGGAASSSTIACYHLGTFLSSSETAALYNSIQAFQTALSRNV